MNTSNQTQQKRAEAATTIQHAWYDFINEKRFGMCGECDITLNPSRFGTSDHDGSGFADCDPDGNGWRQCKEFFKGYRNEKSLWCSECIYLYGGFSR